MTAISLRVRGCVQGVGFRPTVWRLARRLGLGGDVRNDGEGVLIRLSGPAASLEAFPALLRLEAPPLARIDAVEVSPCPQPLGREFSIEDSGAGRVRTQIAPDANICSACTAEILDPGARRHGYPFTNCTHCGPRFSIITAIPYDRARTTMAGFGMCDACLAEYGNPADRRFHAEPTACPICGPQVTPSGGLEDAAERLRQGEIIALKGLGGYQLACDATNADAVALLREKKRRPGKPFALMARDLAIISRFCVVSPEEARQLGSPQAPIVLLKVIPPKLLPETIAPGLTTVGFMLPTTPLHVLLLRHMEVPLVMTSGNFSHEPQIIDDEEARLRLPRIASHIISHDRPIANRIDDSVVCVMAGKPRLLRRARGYAPAPLPLPPGFENTPDMLAMGGDKEAAFCLVKDGQAILSQHQGDLAHPAVVDGFRKTLDLYRALFDHHPQVVACDPGTLSATLARSMALPPMEVDHHHAHIAACLCENAIPLAAPPVLGIVLDGPDWVFLLADYRGFRRLATYSTPLDAHEAAIVLAADQPFRTIALSGEGFQDRALFEETLSRLESAGFAVLSHSRVPPHDGGLSLGQAAIAAARLS